jgi:MFS family permease
MRLRLIPVRVSEVFTLQQTVSASSATTALDRSHRRVVIAASLGAMFEWYDFFAYGAVAVLLSQHFFQGVNDTTSFIFALLGFAAGFAVRPLGAVLFGKLGDSVGRKHTFLVTIILMGISTALIGMLPTYAQIGVVAPILLVSLRLLQGLALGGEYGGAATYVAEHAGFSSLAVWDLCWRCWWFCSAALQRVSNSMPGAGDCHFCYR